MNTSGARIRRGERTGDTEYTTGTQPLRPSVDAMIERYESDPEYMASQRGEVAQWKRAIVSAFIACKYRATLQDIFNALEGTEYEMDRNAIRLLVPALVRGKFSIKGYKFFARLYGGPGKHEKVKVFIMSEC